MRRKIAEKLSVLRAKEPGRLVIGAILLFNVVFFFVAALVISNLSLAGTEKMGFLEAAFCTITMILDAGCIQFVIADIGTAGVAVAVLCLAIVLIGMISFTGAVIGYITNYISGFIDNANAGEHRLLLSDHVVILNWNTRASEIVNDLLYCGEKQTVVVLAGERRTEIEKEVSERLADTVERENRELRARCASMPLFRRRRTLRKEKFRNLLTVIVRQGDVFSSKQLHDISLERARTVVVLGSGNVRPEQSPHPGQRRGDPHVLKTLMQVSDITGADYSSDNQKIVVEIEDDWTWDLVQKIIAYKQVEGKCNIVPVRVNEILGQLLSQFSLMPELNLAYKELFSNKGAAFYSVEEERCEETAYIREYLRMHKHAIPLTFMDSGGRSYSYFAADSLHDVFWREDFRAQDYTVKLNRDYWIEEKNIILLGHNSKCRDIMAGFCSFRAEWNYKDGEREILRIVVIDSRENLERMDYYREYPFVTETVAADIYDKDVVCGTIERVLSGNKGDTSILVLSDDRAPESDTDANALANLIFVQDIINRKLEEDSDFDTESIDLIVEIIDPRHFDIVSSYSVDNVVISNRYISKMVTQIGEKEALFDFYTDILTYDSEDAAENGYESKEIYIKPVSRFFAELPGPCTAAQLIRAVYEASVDEALPPLERYPTIVLGYAGRGGRIVLFSGDQADIPVELTPEDKLIVFSSH